MAQRKFHIGQEDYLLGNRKAAREEEFEAHGKAIAFRKMVHKSQKAYSRKNKYPNKFEED